MEVRKAIYEYDQCEVLELVSTTDTNSGLNDTNAGIPQSEY
jgi:hypothetical protein